MENTWFAIFLFLALLFLLSGTRLRSSGTRKLTAKSRSSTALTAYSVAKPHALPEQRPLDMTSQATYPTPSSISLPTISVGGRPRIVVGSDYLRNNARSHLYSYRAGSEGEQRVVDRMLDVLDAQWTIFRNLDLGNREGDIDIVLVGPGGTWAVEVKNYRGNFRVENGRWYKETSNGRMAKMQYGPGAQVLKNAGGLCEYLKENGIIHNSYVKRAVIMSGDAPVEVVSTGTDIWKLDELDAQLASLRSHKCYSQEHARLIVSVLERACSTSRRVH